MMVTMHVRSWSRIPLVTDGDGLLDICDEDIDGDDRLNEMDNCPQVSNPAQATKTEMVWAMLETESSVLERGGGVVGLPNHDRLPGPTMWVICAFLASSA